MSETKRVNVAPRDPETSEHRGLGRLEQFVLHTSCVLPNVVGMFTNAYRPNGNNSSEKQNTASFGYARNASMSTGTEKVTNEELAALHRDVPQALKVCV